LTFLKLRRVSKFAKLWPYLRPHLAPMALGLLFSIPLAAINVAPVKAVQYLQDVVLVQKNADALLVLVAAIPAAFLLNLVFRFASNYLMRSAANRMIQSLRNDLYQHLLRLSLGYFNEAQGGALLSKVINDVQVIVRAVSSLVDVVKEPLTLLGLLGWAFYLNFKLTVITLLIVPACAVLMSNAGRHSKRYSARILGSLGDMSSLLGESISGMRVIQAFGLERYLRGQFQQLNREFTRASLKAIRVEELSRPAIELVYGLALTFLMFYMGREALAERMSPGDVMAFIACFGMMLQPLRKIGELNVTLSQSSAAIDKVFGVMELVPEVQDKPGARELGPFAREVEFRGVSFSYSGASESRPVLEGFNLRLRKGEVVALVGASGGGKSTVLSLIPRFFDPQAGAILIDGVDLRELSLESLRRQVALVTQEVFLFHDSVRANIKAGRHDISEEAVRAAAEAAQAWPFIQRLPEGLDTVIGDRGQKLSGGERQRLSIARALLSDAPILLLDEATSALDSENERLVQMALDRLLVGRTALVVAHRLSTIRKAHRILVLDRGRVVEEGDHDTLLAKGGFYAKALALQEGFSR